MFGLYDLKNHQIRLAKAIKNSNNNKIGYSEFQSELEGCRKIYGDKALKRAYYDASYEFRHHHIAYCELRGKTREMIEIPADNHLPNEDYIKEIKKFWQEKIDEALRARQERSNS
jgi:hypothetical protein